MTTLQGSGHPAHEVARSKPFQLVARIGMVMYGVVYLLIAWLAAQVAIGGSGQGQPDKSGALQTIASGGWVWLLWVIAVGLAAMALWRLYEVIWGRKRHEWSHRAIGAFKVLMYGYLSYSAAKVAIKGPGAASDSQQQQQVGGLLTETWGRVLVGLAGVAVLGGAAYLVYRGWKRKFQDDLDLSSASPGVRKAVTRAGQFGHMALGAAWAIAGALIVLAAVQVDPSKARGLDASLKTLAAQPYGQILLGVMALGLASYGVYNLFAARYRLPG
ncbi:DUF1206 domain-containing protein [Actinophytocola sp.]|uniref:DUF1206 domain-containing protein n=1 Tax=Actinophytocola sp. TaxID=1872138 RepID=UPI002D7FA1E9|nr:DUF1206 domain-containing protein [Actinophytocola sp.]HET9141303.1 DUF1206 domain-containing protein [Actinophytocola sp.]HEU5110524.1 DUF1206 domain-containing protein [Micromonosporaceae bacterium]